MRKASQPRRYCPGDVRQSSSRRYQNRANKGWRKTRQAFTRRRRRHLHRRAGVHHCAAAQPISRGSGPVEAPAESYRLGRDTRDRPAAPALAPLRISKHATLLLSGRGSGDGHLAQRSCEADEPAKPSLSTLRRRIATRILDSTGWRSSWRPAQEKLRSWPCSLPGRPSMLCDAPTAPTSLVVFWSSLPASLSRIDYASCNPMILTATTRFAILCRRHAHRYGAGEDRYHELPRLQAARRARTGEGKPRASLLDATENWTRSSRKARCSSASCPT